MALVLIIDDDTDILNLTSRYIESTGHQSLTVADPYLVEDFFYNYKIDLVILDINMPGLNGFHLLEQLQKSPVASSCKVLIASATSDQVAIDRAYRLGAAGYLIKPYDRDELLNKIQSLLAPSLLTIALENTNSETGY